MSQERNISEEDKIQFITEDIKNFLSSKQQLENNIFTLLKYYISILAGLFAYTGYIQKVVIDASSNTDIGANIVILS